MKKDPAKVIRAWFADHHGDGEFASGSRVSPYFVIAPSGSGGQVVFSTKTHAVLSILPGYRTRRTPGMIGRLGLPDETDVTLEMAVSNKKQANAALRNMLTGHPQTGT